MAEKSNIFQDHYENYLKRIAEIDLSLVKDTLGLQQKDNDFFLSFFHREYRISKDGILDEFGATPGYEVCVILAKYLILCPRDFHRDSQWVAFRDFKITSHFLNVNFFASDTENVLASMTPENLDFLFNACVKMGGVSTDEGLDYDLVMAFEALPRISLLLLYNAADEDFPASGTVLFQKQAEHFLDPESLAMTSAYLAGNLKKLIH